MVKFRKGTSWFIYGKYYPVTIIKVEKSRIKCIDQNDLTIRWFKKKDFATKWREVNG